MEMRAMKVVVRFEESIETRNTDLLTDQVQSDKLKSESSSNSRTCK